MVYDGLNIQQTARNLTGNCISMALWRNNVLPRDVSAVASLQCWTLRWMLAPSVAPSCRQNLSTFAGKLRITDAGWRY